VGEARDGRPQRRGRGRPALVDRDGIVAAAVALADEQGIEAVTMARVARQLGVAAPALYYHVGNSDELLTAVAESFVTRFPLPNPRLRWDRWLLTFAESFRSLLQERPVLTRLPYLSVHPPFPAESLEQALRVLTRAGFAPDYALVLFGEHVRTVVELVHAEHAREHERRAGRGQLAELRRIAVATSGVDTPILAEVLRRWDGVPDDRGGYDDVLFRWQMALALASWRALLADEVTPRLLGPPRPLAARTPAAPPQEAAHR
jgi:AcrR family transcriptional regulator